MFRLRISVQPKNQEAVRTALQEHGITIDDAAEYEVKERANGSSYLPVKDAKGDRLNIPIEEVIFIESFGRNNAIHTTQQVYLSNARMYQLEEQLLPRGFLRVSRSIIVARKKILKIRPTLSSKYVLTMEDGSLVDVTRNYYLQFRQEFGI